jgi:uncharacterized membrane protein SpoIIM required for sporulation
VDIDTFIHHYRPEWERLEQACARGSAGLAELSGPQIDELVRLYLRASSHLAEVRTRFADPRLEAYLNRVVTTAHNALYGARTASWRSALRFFGSRYQEAARRTLPFILVAAVIFVAVTVAMDVWVAGSRQAQAGLIPAAARSAMQHESRRRDLGPSPALSSTIFLNNVRVTVEAFAVGIFLCLGTLYFLIGNAVLLGELGGFFQAAGKAGTFWPLILPHGLLEVTAICIGAGAGLRMGWAVIDPGDRPRVVALAEEAGDAVFAALGVIPALAIAALIEGFVTPRGYNPVLTIGLGMVVWLAYLALVFGLPARRRPREAGPQAAEGLGGLTASPGI